MKDLTLLGGALWTAGESWVAVERQILAAGCASIAAGRGRAGDQDLASRAS